MSLRHQPVLGCGSAGLRFQPSRAGEHARHFLQDWRGKLVWDDFGGYKASFELGVTEIGCMAHARRKFFELHATNKSTPAEQALRYIQLLYEIESEVRDLEPDLRHRIRQEKAVPVMNMLHAWMIAVSGRRTHLQNPSIKGDGARVFLSGRDRPYRRDFHAPTKLLPQTIQSPGRPGMSATRSDDFQRGHPSRHQR